MTARSTQEQGNTIAFACPCLLSLDSSRPLAGYINWGPNRINLDQNRYREQFGVGIHEIVKLFLSFNRKTHILGFTTSLFNLYPGGDPTISLHRTAPGLDDHPITLVASPKVLEVAREHFNCPTLEGLETENGGGGGTQGSHWERRVVYNEFMTGFSSYDPRISKLTLALLEDSGWCFLCNAHQKVFPQLRRSRRSGMGKGIGLFLCPRSM